MDMAWHGMARGGGPHPEKQEQASVLTPLVLFFLDCLYLPLWPHCLWPCRCITVPLPCSLPFLFPCYLPSISQVFVYSSPYVHVPLVRCPHRSVAFLQGIMVFVGNHKIHGDADSRASSPQIEPCPGHAMPMPCESPATQLIHRRDFAMCRARTGTGE